MPENRSTLGPRPPSNSSQSNLSITSQNQAIVIDQDRIKLSKRRWLLLFAVSVFGFTSSLCSELSPILKTMVKLLGVDVHQYIYISQISYYLLVFVAMPTAWFVDRYGIRISMYMATILMLFRNGLRALMFNPDSPDWAHLKMFYYILSSIIGMAGFTMFFCLPLKISELWFSASERSVAWTVMVSTFSLGVSVGAFTFPRYIHDDLHDIKLLSYLNIGCALITTPIIFLGVNKAEPKYPASERILRTNLVATPYLGTLKKMICHKDIVIHLIHGTFFEGLTLSISALLQDLFASVNKTKIFVGDLIAINALLQIVMLIVLSTFVHRSQNPTLTCKLASVAQTIFLILHIATMKYPMANWIVLIISFFFTISKSWFTPNSTNMLAHLACGNVSQATISGFAMMLTLVGGIIIQTIFVSLAVKVDEDTRDYTNAFMFTIALGLVNSLMYIIFFEGKSEVSEEGREQTVGENYIQP